MDTREDRLAAGDDLVATEEHETAAMNVGMCLGMCGVIVIVALVARLIVYAFS